MRENQNNWGEIVAGHFKSDGSIDADSFSDWSEITAFIETEERDWAWTWAADSHLQGGAKVVGDRFRSGFQKLKQQIRSLQSAGNRPSSGVQLLLAAFDFADGQLVSPKSPFRDEASEIFDAISDEAAVFATGFMRGTVTLAEAKSRDDLRAALWLAQPGLPDPTKLSELLKRERANVKEAVRKAIAEAEKSSAARDIEWAETLEHARRAALGWAIARNRRFRTATRHWHQRHLASENSIHAVETTYKEHMGLAAPVDYWKNKAKEHRRTEFWTRLWVMIYFPIALTAIAVAFNQTGISLINSAKAAQLPGAAPFPNAIFIVASAGLASCAGLVFWVGRLLTKLYLSQHHLRQDAEEQATMTETYLALIENSAASAEDRQVILNALFRSTPDGIVKEEGGLDPSIAAALGKYLAKN